MNTMLARGFAGKRRDEGTILLIVVIVTLLVSATVAGLVATALREGRNATFGFDHAEAMAAADGVTEAAQQRMLQNVANFLDPPLSGTVSVGGKDIPYTAVVAGNEVTRLDVDGVSMAIRPYVINAASDVGIARSDVSRVVELTMTPIFQYMIFYNDDLEILPGPDMTLGGRVHSNGDLYVGCGGTLTVNTEYFRSTGEMLRERKDDGSAGTGTVKIKVTGESAYVNMTTTMDSSNPDWVALALDNWNGTVQSGAHGVKEVASPSIANIKAFGADGQPAYYHSHADLVIKNTSAFDTNGNPVTLPAGTLKQVTMWDGREKKNVKVTEIDIGKLNTSGKFPANGLIYAYRTDATSSQPNGIRLTNGSKLNAPLTVVTEDPLYIKGDFNTVEKKGAAVIADAVNLLSKSWNDTKTSSSLPTASNTTYNVAMITGNVPTPDDGGAYSGGFENLPRFHENWSGKIAKIRGSFINIYESEIADAPWEYGGNVYTAPTRDWQFDEDLNDIDNMPPFTPSAVFFRRVTWDDNLTTPFMVVGPMVEE